MCHNLALTFPAIGAVASPIPPLPPPGLASDLTGVRGLHTIARRMSSPGDARATRGNCSGGRYMAHQTQENPPDMFAGVLEWSQAPRWRRVGWAGRIAGMQWSRLVHRATGIGHHHREIGGNGSQRKRARQHVVAGLILLAGIVPLLLSACGPQAAGSSALA